ncbi:MAG: type II and III secretion system protein family protein [Rhodospirillales bacterium]|nr:type II and III secretion system protein family protein [Rhodospirillales bacterium]
MLADTKNRILAAGAILALLSALRPGAVHGQQPLDITTRDAAGARYAGELTVPLNKSQIVRVDTAFGNLFVGNPEIADVRPLTDRTIYVLGKMIGSTSLSIHSGAGNRPLAVVDLNVTYDVEEAKRRLFELTGGEPIEVRAVRDSLVLSGQVSSAGALARAMSVAERLAPGKVTNLMTVAGSQQVMLAVRFAEMKRTAAKDLGINFNLQGTPGAATISMLSGRGFNPEAFAIAGANMMTSAFAFDLFIDALEEKGVVKTLAEPNLIALSGDTATFLAGGEFPIPVAQSQASGATIVTIEFKEFGVSLAFTPTVIGSDLISLVVAPEVSAIDPSASIELNDLRIPGLTTRRVKTTVELRDGQSFAIAGLIQSNYANQIDQFPFLGDVPVMGPLFRSADFRREETELVIIVTPYLVKSAGPGDLALPTDRFVPPSDLDFFYRGRLQGSLAPADAAGQGGAQLGSRSAGGLDGAYGHVIQ